MNKETRAVMSDFFPIAANQMVKASLIVFHLGLSLCKYTCINNDIFNFYPIFIKMIRFLVVVFITKTSHHSKLLLPSQDHPLLQLYNGTLLLLLLFLFIMKKKKTYKINVSSFGGHHNHILI